MRNAPTGRDDRPILIRVDAEGCTIGVGKKKITVDCVPIAMSQSSFVDTDLAPDGPDRLVLQPTWKQYMLVAVVTCAVPLLLVGMATVFWRVVMC